MDEQVVPALRRAVKDCTDRGLYYASRWASELLLSIPDERRQAVRRRSPDLSVTEQAEAALEEDELDVLSAARSFGDAKEFMRASHLLGDCKSARGRFMRWYYDFMAEEKRALRDWHNLDYSLSQNTKSVHVPYQPPIPVNKFLQELLEMVTDETDPWLLFLKALFLKRLSRREEAIEAAILSIRGYPWNWSTWLLLASCINDRDELANLIPLTNLPSDSVVLEFFQMKVIVDLNTPVEEDLEASERMLSPDFFPNSVWIMSLRAAALYHLHDFHRAEAIFDVIMRLDPMRLDDVDILSNILYVAENRVKLAKIAHYFLTIDKDRPEVCCMVGNHHSLRGEPERAIQYFRRATELDQSYLPAWTLMGHEYVEIKNSHAAIESYRRAIDVNRKDYRAWFGLGQAYELLNMHQYSLYYYQRATALRPYDVRIWQAQGMCYEELGMTREAIECLKRALLGAESYDIALSLKLAKLYDDINDYHSAASYHQRIIDNSLQDNKPTHAFSKSLLYVSRHHLERGGNDFPRARAYAERVAQSNAEEVTAAAELLRRLNASAAGAHMSDNPIGGMYSQTGGTGGTQSSGVGAMETGTAGTEGGTMGSSGTLT